MNPFFFPDWTNRVRLPAGMLLAAAPLYLLGVVYYGGSPKTTDVGYAPKQPIPYSHALHVGQLGMDCKFCHTTVDKAAFAAIPPAETCIGCHGQTIKAKSAKLTPLREAYTSVENKPVEWIKVHDLPDYVYFNHSSHVNRDRSTRDGDGALRPGVVAEVWLERERRVAGACRPHAEHVARQQRCAPRRPA